MNINIKHLMRLTLLGMLIFFTSYQALAQKLTVYVYNDDGVSSTSFLHTLAAFKQALPEKYTVRSINAAAIITNQWVHDAALLVIPGGADLPYGKKLNGIGNNNIKNYVSHGGAYLGICAGAYYGSAYVEFDKHGELEVAGKRELAFFPDTAIGPALAKYNYHDNSGARAALVNLSFRQVKRAIIYYNGGGYFNHTDGYPNVQVLGNYHNGLPAIIQMTVGRGRVILSGVHFEYDPYKLDAHDPHLTNIIIQLKSSDHARRKLLHLLIAQLGLI